MKTIKPTRCNVRIGIALASGGSRGCAHSGVLRVLEREGIPIAAVAGTSIGALVGGVYAAGIPADHIQREWLEADLPRVVRAFLPGFPRAGLSSGREMERYIRSLIGDVRFEDLPIPFAAVACDLNTGEAIVLQSGPLAKAIRASASIPGVFHPVRWDGRLLVDGGLVDPLPIRVCRQLGADVVIGVDVVPLPSPLVPNPPAASKGIFEEPHKKLAPEPSRTLQDLLALLRKGVTDGHPDGAPLPGVYSTVSQAVAIFSQGILQPELSQWPADVLVRPQLPPGVSYLNAARGIAAGEEAMEAALPGLRALVQSKTT